MINYISKFLYVISAKKSSLLLLLSLFLFTSLLDALGIGLVGPFIGLATNPKMIFENPWLTWAYTQLGSQSTSKFIALLGLFIIIVFCGKSFLYFHVQKYVYQFSFTQMGRLRLRLMHAYLAVPYTFHLGRNSALIIQNLVNETQNFCFSVELPLLNAAANFIVLIALLLLLLKTDAVATVSILGILLLAFLGYNLFKDKIVLWGKESSEANTEIIRIINHSLGGLKETKVIGCEPYFEKQAIEQINKFSHSGSLTNIFILLPRIAIESILITFVVGFTSISQFFSNNPENAVSILGVFAVASIRLMPSASQFMSAVGTLRNYSYCLDKLYFDLKELEKEDASILQDIDLYQTSNSGYLSPSPELPLRTIAFAEKFTIDRISYSYPNVSEPALKEVYLQIKKGQSIAFIGKSGAGKTTLVDVILGLLTPDGGDIKVDEKSIYNDIRSWQNLIGYIPQSIFLTDDTVERNIAFGVPDELINQEKLHQAIKAAQLEELIAKLPDGIKTAVGERGVRLSGGQRQRIGIARALYHEREILVLDEATAALDNETESLITQAMQALSGKKTLIIIAHRLSTVEQCDCIYVMEKGRIIKSGTYREVVLEASVSEG